MARSSDPLDLVVHGRVALPGGAPAPAAVGVRDGRIVAITAPSAAPPAAAELDAGDALVLPGAIDVHVHTSSTTAEGIAACTRAAAAGGVTTIVDMPYDEGRIVSTPDAFAAKVADVEREAVCDVALWATVPPTGPLDDIDALVAAGACAFKLSTFDTDPQRFPRIPDDQLLRAFQRIAAAGSLAGVHAENDEIVRGSIAALRAAGRRDPRAHAQSRPPVAELEAVGRCLAFAEATGVRLHLCHQTLGRALELVAAARARGIDVSAETCPHYLLLDEDDLARLGGPAKINPPLRPAAEIQALWDGITDGAIDLVSSDHVGWPAERKHGEDIFALASGAPGVELIVTLLHDALTARGLGVERLVTLLCEAPARRFGLWPRKGVIALGADADLVVLDPDEQWTVDPAALATKAHWSPYTGRELRGRVRKVILRGELVADAGRVLAEPGGGCFIAGAGAPPATGGGRTATGRDAGPGPADPAKQTGHHLSSGP